MQMDSLCDCRWTQLSETHYAGCQQLPVRNPACCETVVCMSDSLASASV